MQTPCADTMRRHHATAQPKYGSKACFNWCAQWQFITIHQVLDPSRFIYQGFAPRAFRIRQSKNSGRPQGAWPPRSTSTDAAGWSWLMSVTVCNKKATVTASILTPKLHPDKSSEYTKQMAVYCADCQYSVSQLLQSTCNRTRCELEAHRWRGHRSIANHRNSHFESKRDYDSDKYLDFAYHMRCSGRVESASRENGTKSMTRQAWD